VHSRVNPTTSKLNNAKKVSQRFSGVHNTCSYEINLPATKHSNRGKGGRSAIKFQKWQIHKVARLLDLRLPQNHLRPAANFSWFRHENGRKENYGNFWEKRCFILSVLEGLKLADLNTK
jgi:hypothetical protein